MKQLVAIHVVIRGDEAGKIERIEPGESFSSEDKEAEDLLACDAARLAVKGDAVAETADKDDEAKLEDLTKAQLIEHAKEHGIEVDEKATKAVILAAVQAAGSDDLV